MISVHSLIAKVFSNFINTINPSNNESLKVKFIGNPQIEFLIQCIMMGSKRAGICTTIKRLENWCFHLQKFQVIQITTQKTNDFGAFYKSIPNVRVNDQIQMSIAITVFLISKCVECFPFFFFDNRQRAYGFTKYSQDSCVN